MAEGGSWRSVSMTTMASPRAWSIPALIATWWPKFLEKLTILTLGSRRRSSRRISAERSLEPSSTKMNSCLTGRCARTSLTVR